MCPRPATISEMVLDAFQSTRESEQIRELRAAIRQAHDSFDDDKAHELMGELKQLEDAEAADIAALEDLSSKFRSAASCPVSRTTRRSRKSSTAWPSKVLNQTHQAISNPSGGKSKAAKAKKKSKVFTISKDGMSVTLPLRTPRPRLNVDREALEFLGFSFVGEGDEAELPKRDVPGQPGRRTGREPQEHHHRPATADRLRRLQHRRPVSRAGIPRAPPPCGAFYCPRFLQNRV